MQFKSSYDVTEHRAVYKLVRNVYGCVSIDAKKIYKNLERET